MYNKNIESQFFIIDFDSTFITVEALDSLANIALTNNPHKDTILHQIATITRECMEGKIDFPTSLAQRLQLFHANRQQLEQLILLLQEHITPSVTRNKDFFMQYAEHIYIISGGFIEYIAPVVKAFGIDRSHILANTFLYDEKGNIQGFNHNNLLAQTNGKGQAVASLHLKGDAHVIGDGYTDFQIKEQGLAKNFFAFTENIQREAVITKADKVIGNFDELLHLFKLPRSQSFPKSKMKVLLLENINAQAVKVFEKEGFIVESLNRALTESELIEKIATVSILGIRSKTEITQKVVAQAKKLLAIGAFCIGTNQIDISAASEKGIAIFNAPYSNTRSVVELVMGEIIMLYRKTFEKSVKMHAGIWDKSATGSQEVRGKKLGIIGYGNIGTQLSVLAESFGMQVYFYDITDKLALGNAHKCETLEELLATVDVITVHVDGRKENKNLIGQKEFMLMRDNVIFLNLSRGFIVDLVSLTANLASGKIRGAAVDVFPEEPKSNTDPFISPLRGLPNVILTPHVGGSTEEAQRNIGEFVSHKLIQFINAGSTTLSVNFPGLQLPDYPHAHRFIHIHNNIPGVLAHINNTLAKNNVNILGQYLKTNEHIGYVITDVSTTHKESVINACKEIPGTIRFRELY